VRTVGGSRREKGHRPVKGEKRSCDNLRKGSAARGARGRLGEKNNTKKDLDTRGRGRSSREKEIRLFREKKRQLRETWKREKAPEAASRQVKKSRQNAASSEEEKEGGECWLVSVSRTK